MFGYNNYPIKRNSTSVLVQVFVPRVDATTGDIQGYTGITGAMVTKASYFQEGATADTAFTVTGTHTVGTYTAKGWKQIDSTNLPGWYEFGVPNACLVQGFKWVNINLHYSRTTNVGDVAIHIDLLRSIAW